MPFIDSDEDKDEEEAMGRKRRARTMEKDDEREEDSGREGDTDVLSLTRPPRPTTLTSELTSFLNNDPFKFLSIDSATTGQYVERVPTIFLLNPFSNYYNNKQDSNAVSCLQSNAALDNEP